MKTKFFLGSVTVFLGFFLHIFRQNHFCDYIHNKKNIFIFFVSYLNRAIQMYALIIFRVPIHLKQIYSFNVSFKFSVFSLVCAQKYICCMEFKILIYAYI
jgi:hypothetical protein